MSAKIIINIYYQPSAFIKKLLADDNGKLYFAINGGASLKGEFFADWLHFDDCGDNISQHNHALNEMTSIYWFWKNYDWQNIDYIGFNHYRRLFNPKDLQDYFDYDAIVAKPFNWSNIDLETQYFAIHNSLDLDVLIHILEKTDNIVAQQFKQYLCGKQLYAPCNMFLMKAKHFDNYCKFMFPILLQCVDSILLPSDKYQHRAIAFLSERLTSFWLKQLSQNAKIKEIPVEFII